MVRFAAGLLAAAAVATCAALAATGLTIVASVHVPSQDGILGVASGAGAVWSADGVGTLSRVDPKTDRVVARVKARDVSEVAAGLGTG